MNGWIGDWEEEECWGRTNYSFVPRAEGSRCAGAESAIFEGYANLEKWW